MQQTSPIQGPPAPCVIKQDGDTHVRSVVLRHIMGQVGMNRGRGRGMELAMRNSPIVEGAKLVTADGYAEVTLEDLMHVRLTPDTVVEFEQLALHMTGERASVIALNLGTIYVDTPNVKGSKLRIQVGAACISLDRGTHLRMEITRQRVELAMLYGNASVEAPAGHAVALTRNESLSFSVPPGEMAKIIPGIEERPYDEWEAKAVKRYQPFLRLPPSVWP